MSMIMKLSHWIFLASICLWGSWGFCGPFDGEDPREVGQKGCALYEEGDYKQAGERLKFALETISPENRGEFAAPYAQICQRELDGQKHTMGEAASWYLEAADGGDPDMYAALLAEDPMLVDISATKENRIVRLKQAWRVAERVYYANEGSRLHFEGIDLERAYRYLKRASQGYHPLAQGLYADVCGRQLDGKFHLNSEAAMWYVLAAKGGSDAAAFLSSIPGRTPGKPYDERDIECLSNFWVVRDTFKDFNPLKPQAINDYLMWHGYKDEMTAVAAQKIPYFFDKIVNGLLFEMGLNGYSLVEDVAMAQKDDAGYQVPLAKRQKTCHEEAQELEHVVSVQVTPWVMGLVYKSYWKTLQAKSGGKPVKPLKEPTKIPALFALMLDHYGNQIKKHKLSKEWSEKSHQEYPWIWAGIRYWKIYPENKGRSFDVPTMTEDQLFGCLENHVPLEKRDLEEILKKIERPEIWPRAESVGDLAEGTKAIMKGFQERVLRFFGSRISREDPFVTEIIKDFREKVQQQKLNFTQARDRSILSTPLLMHAAHELILTEVRSTKAHYELLRDAGKYFSNMKKIQVHFAKGFDEAKGKDIIDLLRKLAKKGIEVTYS